MARRLILNWTPHRDTVVRLAPPPRVISDADNERLTHRITNATAEGLNSKIQWIRYTAHGYRNRENFKTAIYFHCGKLDLYPH